MRLSWRRRVIALRLLWDAENKRWRRRCQRFLPQLYMSLIRYYDITVISDDGLSDLLGARLFIFFIFFVHPKNTLGSLFAILLLPIVAV